MKQIGLMAGCLVLTGGVLGAEPEFGLVRSVDGGDTWVEATEHFRSNRVNVLSVATNRIWAGTDHGLFASANDGLTWEHVGGTEFHSARVLSLTAGGGVMLAGTERAGIWRSTDDGQNWTRVTGAKYVRSLAQGGGKFWAGLDDGTVWVSKDSGTTWDSMSIGLPEDGQVFALHADPKGRLYAGLYSRGFYEFREGIWRRLGKEACPLVIFVADDVLLAGHNPGGIHRSTDGGASWHKVTAGAISDAPSWAFAEVRGSIFYGTTGVSGLYASTDRGTTWRPVAPDYLHNRAVVALTSSGTTLFAATVGRPASSGLDNALIGDIDGTELLLPAGRRSVFF